MNDIDGQDTEFIDDDEVQITDLDPPDSPQQRRAALIANVVRRGLTTPWIRYSLSSILILILLGALTLQWPRPAPTLSNASQTPARYFLSATTVGGLVFVQGSDFTLTAYQTTTWRARWHASLPAAANINAQGQTLYCYFATPARKTELEALNANTGKVIWHDILPAILTDTTQQISRGQAIPAFLYSNNTLYAQSTSDTVYAIQASTGHINWTYQVNDPGSPPQQPGTFLLPWVTLNVQHSIVEFMSTNDVAYILDASTGRKIISLPLSGNLSWPVIDGQMIYTLPPPGGPAIQAFHIPDGQHLWTYRLPKDIWAQSESDGIIYLTSASGNTLIALRGSDGHQLWSYQTSDDRPLANPFFSESDGIIYLFQQDATLVSIRESDGHVLWRTMVTDFAGQLNQNTMLFLDNGKLVARNLTPDSSLPIDVLSTSDGHLLWHSSGPIANAYLVAGTLYGIANNGQIDAWRESDGQHLWSYDAPIGSSIVFSLQSVTNLLFLQDVLGNLYAVRTTDGKLLWRYP